MKNTTLTARDFLSRGDVDGLIKFRRALHGGTTMTAPVQQTPSPANMPDSITIPVPPAPAPAVQTFTQADIEAAIERTRQQEKDKLYPEIETLRASQAEAAARIAAFDTDLTARQQAEAAAVQKAEEEAEARRKAELSFEDRVREMTQDTGTQISALQEQINARDALLAREREFNDLQTYQSTALTSVQDQIMPDLVQYIGGGTREEIDASIQRAMATSAQIVQGFAAAQAGQQQQARVTSTGVGITAPPTGSMDVVGGTQTFTSTDIANMSVAEYAANRNALLGSASQSQQGRGLYG
jgi:hypothetical protein